MQFSLKQNDVFVLLVPCAPGMYMVSSQCVPCPEGHYQPLPGQLTCEPCTENRTVVDSGTNCTGKNKLGNSNISFKEKMEPSIDLYFYSLLFSFSKFIIMLLFYFKFAVGTEDMRRFRDNFMFQNMCFSML